MLSLKRDRASISIVECHSGSGPALVASVDALHRAGLGRGSGFIGRRGRRLVAGGKREQGAGDEEQSHAGPLA